MQDIQRAAEKAKKMKELKDAARNKQLQNQQELKRLSLQLRQKRVRCETKKPCTSWVRSSSHDSKVLGSSQRVDLNLKQHLRAQQRMNNNRFKVYQ